MTDYTTTACQNEEKIIRKMYELLAAEGWKLNGYDDGSDEITNITSIDEALATTKEVEEIRFYFHKENPITEKPARGKTCSVYLIFGNGNYGLDVIADHSDDKCGFADVMDELQYWINDKQLVTLP